MRLVIHSSFVVHNSFQINGFRNHLFDYNISVQKDRIIQIASCERALKSFGSVRLKFLECLRVFGHMIKVLKLAFFQEIFLGGQNLLLC